jgi:hypothetical protein
VGDKGEPRKKSLKDFSSLLIRARNAGEGSVNMQVGLIDKWGKAFTANVTLDAVMTDIRIPLSNLQPGSSLLLPRPYPGFLPLWFKAVSAHAFDIHAIDKLEILFTKGVGDASVELQSVFLIQ